MKKLILLIITIIFFNCKTENKSQVDYANSLSNCLTIESVIPSKTISVNGVTDSTIVDGANFGIGSMGINEVETSSQTITLEKVKDTAYDIPLTITSIDKKVPTGIWSIPKQEDNEDPLKKDLGKVSKPGVNDKQFIEALTGVSISLDKLPVAEHTKAIDRKDLMTHEHRVLDSIKWDSTLNWNATNQVVESDIASALSTKAAVEGRTRVLSLFNIKEEVDLTRFKTEDYLFTS
tara:strand:+ start:56 stop:757 length:702 start_codon:yes stop_codon:yes gene_type:complete